jgi:hypothetical protein
MCTYYALLDFKNEQVFKRVFESIHIVQMSILSLVRVWIRQKCPGTGSATLLMTKRRSDYLTEDQKN